MNQNLNLKITEITSAQNPRYKQWLKILESKGIKKYNEAIISGRSFLNEILTEFPSQVLGIITSNIDELDNYNIPTNASVYLLPNELFSSLDIYGIKAPLLIISAPAPQPWNETLASGLTLFLPLQNPINLGTCIRNAAALGAEVVLLKEAATPYLPKCLRASGPAIFQVKLWEGPSIKDLAQYDKLPIYALSPNGMNLFSFNFLETMGLVAGIEGPGLDQYWSENKRLSIPMQPKVESLNTAVAVGMAMACRLAHLNYK
ncbi:TrmH family RNA methyltransferase [Desulfovibrio litoralis]|uniref:RNA methyltransferase, TrmH family n=1 Tax=Desulfovibrio litoralis DSM 11393 TaxID=1121455 RepID=A0A1M7T8H1_9BACT|nr:TrmH family RNA methyltransferase [Desulfovibrio litoralis]SHN67035.1 RNA methyltransferase, TrmH family [Desulfovibrio litoralis DSM 11393]